MLLKYKSGNTPFFKVDNLTQKFGCNVFIKDESKNPFGTFKDRRSELILKKAIKEHVDKLVLITSGNAGYSLERFSEMKGIKVISIIDKRLNERIKRRLEKHGKIIEVDLSKKIFTSEDVINLVACNDKEKIWDVTYGFHRAYEKIIE